MGKIFGLSVIVAALGAGPTFAESYTGGQNNNPFLNSTPAPTGSAPESKSGDAQFFSSPSAIQDNSAANAANGREHKAGDAQNQGNAGMGAAIAAGAALTAAGMKEMSELNLKEAARLFGLAGMEFAQAGASAASASDNGSQRSMLLANSGQGGSQVTFNADDVAKNLMTDQAKAALQAQGVDPASFLKQLASGGIRSGSDALGALGKADEVPAEQANDYSSVDMGSFLGTPPEDLGEMPRELLGMRDAAQPNPMGGGPGAAGGGGGVGGINAAESSGSSAEVAGTLSQPRGASSHPAAMAVLDKKDSSVTGLSTENGSLSIHGLGVGTAAKAELAPGVTRAELLTLGVTRARGQNIFRVANRNYRSFSKWRALRANHPKGRARDIASF